MTSARRVAVAMSGGLDSAVAAALLLERGFRVEGVTMRLWHERPGAQDEAIAAARSVCRALGVPHRVVDLRQVFYQDVVGRFLQEYARGRTPNPCLQCNRLLKFGALLSEVRRSGIDTLATGHYARVDRVDGRYRLLVGSDRHKDQSYFLYTLGQAQLAALEFPLGTLTKAQVRDLARQRDLPVAERPESQDVCFVPGGYRQFLARHLPGTAVPGPIVSGDGRTLGQHQGLPFYTVGQREGLGISAPYPLYVLGIDPPRNALVVGPAQALERLTLEAEEVSFVRGSPPAEGEAVEVRIRHRARRQAARVWPLGDGRMCVRFAAPLRGIAPGQAVVLYSGDEVLGGGIIAGAVD